MRGQADVVATIQRNDEIFLNSIVGELTAGVAASAGEAFRIAAGIGITKP